MDKSNSLPFTKINQEGEMFLKRKRFYKIFSPFMVFALVLMMIAPMSATANTDVQPFKQNRTNESIMQAKAAILDQLNVKNGPATLHENLQKLSGDQEVEVIIHLSENPVALEQGIKELAGQKFTLANQKAIQAKVHAQQSLFKKQLAMNNIVVEEGFSYETVLNGMSAKVKAGDLNKLLTLDGVTLIEPVVEVHALESKLKPVGTSDAAMDTSIPFLGIEKLWEAGYKGKGIKVAVLDTGIDYNHPDFEGIYKGGKNFVPHTGNDYARDRADDDPYETTPEDKPANRPEFNANGSSFYTSHGTHVAGTIAAIGNNEYGISGIAPEVDLYAYRVLGAYGSGSNAGVIAAINYAVEQEMDVINLSLGGGSNTSTTADTVAINNAMLAGTIAVSATGNSGPNRGTIGTPATAPLGIAVGNTTNPEASYEADVIVEAGDYTNTSNIKLMGTTYGIPVSDQLNGEFEIIPVPGVGQPSDYDGLDAEGKFVLVSRGQIAFVDKIAAAKEAGAVGLLIHNFAGGTNAPNPSGTFLGDDFEFLPTFDVSQTEGDKLRTALEANGGNGAVSFENVNVNYSLGDEVNSSSSRGPTTPHFDIKPDILAPGTNIMSTIPMYGKDYEDTDYSKAFTRKTGTSMATPHIAGIVALIKQANPEWNAFDVKVALSNTAKVVDTSKYDVFSQGPGRVQPYEAAFPKVLAYALDTVKSDGEEVENNKGTVTFGKLDLVEQDVTVTKQIAVRDLQDVSGDFTVEVVVTKQFGDATVTVDEPTFTLNGEKIINVTLTASQVESTETGDELLGYIYIRSGGEVVEETSLEVDQTELSMKTGEKVQLKVTESTTETTTDLIEVSLPFAADFAGEVAPEIKNMSIATTDLSFNGDGVNDSTDLTFTLTGDVKNNYIEIFDLQNPDGGQYGDGYIGYLHAGASLAAGSYRLGVTGMYTPWTPGSSITTIPDGLYTIDFSALTDAGVISDYVGPIFVKSTAGIIEGQVDGTVASGKVVDKYIDYAAVLASYSYDLDVNSKLDVEYEVLTGEEVKSAGQIELEQDGTYTFDLGEIEPLDQVKVKYVDAAGNKAEKVIFEGTPADEEAVVDEETPEVERPSDDVTNPEDPAEPEAPTTDEQSTLVQVSALAKPKNNATSVETSVGSKTPVVKGTSAVDVTTEAVYEIADEKVVSVEDGLVTAKAAGKTTITITHGDSEPIVVNVTVTNPSSGGGVYIPPTQPETEDPGKEDPETEVMTFTDVPENHWAAEYISKATKMGVFKGYEDGSFKPNNPLTRAQAASLLARALGLNSDEAAPFGDIAKYDKTTQAEIAGAFKAGIIKGDNGNFKPGEKVTRAQLALMIARAYELKTGDPYKAKGIAPFSDFGNYNEETVNAITFLYDFEYAAGFEGKFMPQNATTRAHAAKIFILFLESLE